jgi:hypothetical protein
MQIADKILFNKYEWRVLDIKGNMALIITEGIIKCRPYHNILMDITWADSDMRKYLNSEFYDGFIDDEKSRIVAVINKTPDNPWFGTKGGEDTEDKIFNLTFEDVVSRYFGDSSALIYNRGKNQDYWFQRKDKNNNKRIAKYIGNEDIKTSNKNQWHLRTPGKYQNRIACVGTGGSAHITGNPVKSFILDGRKAKDIDHMGIRPALWLKF